MPTQDAIVVLSAAALAGLISSSVDGAVERAVRRTFAGLVEKTVVEDEWVTPRVAARLYGRHRSTLHRWSRAGLLPTRKIGSSRYYSRLAVERLAG